MINKYQKFKFQKFSKDPFHINLLIPNFITLLGLCLGVSSLKFALNGDWNFSLVAIFFAALFDFLDGALARMLKATSVFGAQLDSLSDFMCFGITPAFIIYCWNYQIYNMFGWISVIFFILCMVIRLARFNTDLIKNDKNHQTNQINNQNQPLQKKTNLSFFKGVPITACAMLVLLPMILTNKNGFDIEFNKNFLKIGMPLYTIFISFLAISKFPTFSLKNLKISKKYFSFSILGLGLIIILLITYPWKIIPIILFLYFISIIFSILKYQKIN
jgi:CDP-diacylglycerol--serine O-phosphatidyltransferase